ncbi:MAG TPA: Rrf2 family transcriptional regulator [Candidatus Polarisedimenticolia bacterium]|nr:Rrf2 family transcriptional regulator [Candidatus Polarisedimenticolia bacterium]
MKWNKSTRFALYAALEMARGGEGRVTASSVAAKYRISSHHLAKVLQQMVRSGLAAAVRGVGGGYRLARSPKEITLYDIVEVFEGAQDLERCMLTDSSTPCAHPNACSVKKVFDEIEQQAYFTLKSIRLSTLAASPAEKGK